MASTVDYSLVKRIELIRQIGRTAQLRGIEWRLQRRGRRHDIWKCGETKVSIPRHNEINEVTAEAIMKSVSAELGDGWWR